MTMNNNSNQHHNTFRNNPVHAYSHAVLSNIFYVNGLILTLLLGIISDSVIAYNIQSTNLICHFPVLMRS